MSASGRFRWRFILNVGDKKKGGNLPAKGKVATKLCVLNGLFLNSSLSSSQACDGHTEGRAAYIVQTYLVAELNR